jgi:hypothetical protein
MNNNPLSKYFRQAGAYVKLPTLGIWYTDGSVSLNDEGEIPIYPLSAIDDILLNTPDAMLNGQALEKVVKNCAPDVKNIKQLLIPDLETIFVGMKAASNNGKFDIDKKCPKCEYENTYEIDCNRLLDSSVAVDESDRKITFNNELEVWVKPYTFEMRQIFIKREFEEEKLLRAIDESNKKLDELEKAGILAESVDRISKITFDLVSKSIEKIVLLQTGDTITDQKHINEWLTNISKKEADIVIESVNKLNSVGPKKDFQAQCKKCEHVWTETLNFDPTSFFVKPS